MRDIPSDVFRQILSLLPAELLLQLRCVCKAWRNTVDDPTFINLHLHRQIHASSNGVGQLILRGELDSRLYALPLESLNNSDVSKEIIRNMPLIHNPFEGFGLMKLEVGSCNGIMLISHSNGHNFLWNLLTREFRKLPPPKITIKKSTGLYLSVRGLGYDCVADDYNVVKIAQVFDPRNRILKSETLVYSLKFDSWRKIKDLPYRISRLGGGILLNGALHWISTTKPFKSMDNLIIGLDLGSEDYRVLLLPVALPGPKKPSATHLGVLDGCLILSCYYQIERLDVWLMKDYGVRNSWIKLFSVSRLDNIGAVETLRPISYSKCKRWVLLQHDKKEFFWFDVEINICKKIRVHCPPTTFSSHFCVPSLVRLNVGGGDGGCSKARKQARDKGKILFEVELL
ncbi:hypothetical protein BUALT_Bualt12G0085700 [Buddleja alternifolia]|uniref:F-box domain-containing protein n=1 Tax=Buddleja alternifolia TaxID=168488 RepID=A0AAV6WPW1_9LAMI|nr:hypothetical protein BUALT_Bualt12G0085700 [Buddleja alternifolia]